MIGPLGSMGQAWRSVGSPGRRSSSPFGAASGDVTFFVRDRGLGVGSSAGAGRTFLVAFVVATFLVVTVFFVAVFPIWSLLIIAADVLIIYGLCIHDRQFK